MKQVVEQELEFDCRVASYAADKFNRRDAAELPVRFALISSWREFGIVNRGDTAHDFLGVRLRQIGEDHDG